MKKLKILILTIIILCLTMSAVNAEMVLEAHYTPLGVPNINSSFKTYMDFRTITNTSSAQYKFLQAWGWTDSEGFVRASGERTLGINDDYYFVALGSYYGTTIGTKYRITTDTGNVFYAVLGDCKDNRHTNSTHQYSYHNDIVEVIVNTRCLNPSVRSSGSANAYMPLNGSITSIERIDFVWVDKPLPQPVALKENLIQQYKV